jgi:hypothetical protein
MRRFLMVPALLLALLAPAAAQFPAQHPDGVTMPMVATPMPAAPPLGGPVAIGQAQAQVDPGGKVAIVMAPAVAPAEPTASFSIGTWIADLLGALVAVFGTAIGTFVTKWVMAVAKKAGIDATQAMSDRLDQIITNGLHSGAAQLGHDITGKLNVQVKNQVIADAVTYAQTQASDMIKGSVSDPKTVQALQARAAKVLSEIGPDAVTAPVAVMVAAPAAAAPVAGAPVEPIPVFAAAPMPGQPTVMASFIPPPSPAA